MSLHTWTWTAADSKYCLVTLQNMLPFVLVPLRIFHGKSNQKFILFKGGKRFKLFFYYTGISINHVWKEWNNVRWYLPSLSDLLRLLIATLPLSWNFLFHLCTLVYHINFQISLTGLCLVQANNGYNLLDHWILTVDYKSDKKQAQINRKKVTTGTRPFFPAISLSQMTMFDQWSYLFTRCCWIYGHSSVLLI